MPSKNINQLTALDTVSTNLSNTLFVVYDTDSGTTKKATLSQIDTAIERSIQNVSSAAIYANAAFNAANSSNILAQAAFNQANTGGGLTANSVATLNNKTFDVSVSSNNIFSIQGQSITAYSGSGQVVLLQQSPTISVLNLNDSQLNLDGGTGSYYWSGQSGVAQAGDLKAGVYSSDPSSTNSLFTFGGAGANNMSVSVEGSLFVGTAKPSNDGGLNTTYPGWLVVQSGAKFGGDIDTLGGLTLYGNIYSTSACSSINFVANSSGDGLGASTMQLVPDGNLTGTDQYLIIDPTAPGHIHIRAGGIQDGSSADLFLGGEFSHFKVSAGANNEVSISSNSYNWQFENDGTLKVPGAVNFQQNANIPLGGPAANGVNDRITLWDFEGGGTGYNYAIGAEGNHIWFSMDVNNGTGGFKFYSRDNQVFKIRDDGALLFSDNTVQTTAYDSSNVSANTITANNLTVSNTFTVSGVVLQWHTPVPLTSKGDPGDKAGYIAIDNDKIYRCVADYTDGTADIWRYINFTGGTWG